MSDLGDYCFEVGLVNFDESSPYGDFSNKWFDDFGNFAFLMMEGRIYFMRFDLDCDARPDPFCLFLFTLLSFILFLQLFVQLLDVVHLFGVKGSLIFDLPL